MNDDALYAERMYAEQNGARAAFLGYGRNDYVLGKPFHAENLATWEGMTEEQGKAWYAEGWNSAVQEEQEKGRAVFLLDELVSRMGAGDEWYGTSFDEPIALVERIKKIVSEESALLEEASALLKDAVDVTMYGDEALGYGDEGSGCFNMVKAEDWETRYQAMLQKKRGEMR